ncbi:hypothetical protein LPB41_19810 [Thalassospira sp. MA62]|nr:hypothetical protein [Thalassospira sp. MA62]
MSAIFANRVSASVRFDGDGVRNAFPFDFDVFDAGDISVSLDGQVLDRGYHVTLSDPDDAVGGTVVFETIPANGSMVMIARVMTLRRISDYGAMSVPRADVLDRDLDFLTAAMGDVDRAMTASLRLRGADIDRASTELPAIAAGRALMWNETGDGLCNGPMADDIAQAQSFASVAQTASDQAVAADLRCQTARAAFDRDDAGAMLDIDFRGQNILGVEDERRMPVIDASVNRIMDARETGSLVRLSNGARLTLPKSTVARNGVRFRVFNGDGTIVDIASATGDTIVPVNGATGAEVYRLPHRGDMVDVICDGGIQNSSSNSGRWFACPVQETGPVMKLLRTSSQDIPAGGAFVIEWDQVIEDSHARYDNAIHGPSNLPPGFYQVDIGVKFPVTDQVAMTGLYLERFNGSAWSTHLQSSDITAVGSGAYHTLRLAGLARIDVGPSNGLRVCVGHSSPQTRPIGQSDLVTWWHLHRIGGA